MQLKRRTFWAWTLFVIIISSLMTVLSYHLFVFNTFSTKGESQAFRDIGAAQAAQSPIKTPNSIIEVMSYGCHYCAMNEANIAAFRQSLPRETSFKVIHVAGSGGLATWAPIFATLEEMGLEKRLRDNAYYTIITQNQNLNDPLLLDGWLRANNVDVARYHEVSASAAVHQRLSDMKAITRYYDINATPMFIINGRYVVAQDADFPEFSKRMLELLEKRD